MEPEIIDQNTIEEHKGWPPWICGQQNVCAHTRDHTDQNTGKVYTPSHRIKIKFPDPTVNQTRSTDLEGRDFTDYTMATVKSIYMRLIVVFKYSFS